MEATTRYRVIEWIDTTRCESIEAGAIERGFLAFPGSKLDGKKFLTPD
jgi:hypothetical protein